MNKIRVAYVVTTLERSGPNVPLVNILKCIDRERFYPFVITLYNETDHSFVSTLNDLEVPMYLSKQKRLNSFIFGKNGLRKTIRKLSPHIIHSQGLRPDLWCSSIKFIPRMSTLHWYPPDLYVSRFGELVGKWMAIWHINRLKVMEMRIACSESLANAVRERHGIDMIPIQNGLDTEVFKPVTTQQKLELRTELNLPLRKYIFIYAGKLWPLKNVVNLIDEFQNWTFKNKRPRTSILLIAGDGPLLSQCKEQAKEGSDIIFVGHIKYDIYKYYQASDYFISASLSEGLPYAVLEAMACGLPVVLSGIKPHTEILEKIHGCGFMFNPNARGDCARAIEMVQALNCKTMDMRMFEKINEYFSSETMYKQYEKRYFELMSLSGCLL